MDTAIKTPSRFVKWALIIGIVVVLNLFFNYAISLVYKAPVYPTAPQIVREIATREECVAIGGQWNENIYPAPVEKSAVKGYCDPDYTARMQYEAARKEYERTVFSILVVLGALVMGIGIVLKERFETLAIAFSWGGVLSFLIASMRYWSDANNVFKVIILAVALTGLIWLALRKFQK